MLSYLQTYNLAADSRNFIMPTVTVQGKTFTCKNGANLRKVLLKHDINLHNGQSKIINCRGIGSCGTCAVAVDGKVSAPNWRDRTRRSRLDAVALCWKPTRSRCIAPTPFSCPKSSSRLPN